MSHWDHTAWKNTETAKFSTGSEEPVLHKEIIHPLVVIDFLKIRVYFLSWSPSFPFNTAVLQLGFISVISTCSCRSSCAGLLLSFTCCISPLVMSWRHERFQWKCTSRTLRKQPGRLVFLLLLLTLSTAWVPECSIWSVSCLIFICVACRISWCLSSCDVPLILLWALLSNTCYVSSDCDYDCRNAPLEHTRMKLLAPLIVKQRGKKASVFPFCT